MWAVAPATNLEARIGASKGEPWRWGDPTQPDEKHNDLYQTLPPGTPLAQQVTWEKLREKPSEIPVQMPPNSKIDCGFSTNNTIRHQLSHVRYKGCKNQTDREEVDRKYYNGAVGADRKTQKWIPGPPFEDSEDEMVTSGLDSDGSFPFLILVRTMVVPTTASTAKFLKRASGRPERRRQAEDRKTARLQDNIDDDDSQKSTTPRVVVEVPIQSRQRSRRGASSAATNPDSDCNDGDQDGDDGVDEGGDCDDDDELIAATGPSAASARRPRKRFPAGLVESATPASDCDNSDENCERNQGPTKRGAGYVKWNCLLDTAIIEANAAAVKAGAGAMDASNGVSKHTAQVFTFMLDHMKKNADIAKDPGTTLLSLAGVTSRWKALLAGITVWCEFFLTLIILFNQVLFICCVYFYCLFIPIFYIWYLNILPLAIIRHTIS
jgi:hypothetical protein